MPQPEVARHPTASLPTKNGPGMTERHLPPARAAAQREAPVLPAGGLRRTSRLAALPLRHAARTAVAATRLSRVAADQVAARTAEQLFGTLGELKGGAAKLGQAMSVLEAAMPEEVAAPYRAALRRLTDAVPPMPAEVAHRVIAADLGDAIPLVPATCPWRRLRSARCTTDCGATTAARWSRWRSRCSTPAWVGLYAPICGRPGCWPG